MEIKEKILQLSDKYFEQVINHRKWLHQHPETAFQETVTSQYIADFLKSNDIPFEQNIAKTGIVAVLKGVGSGEGVLALRADMDALEIEETNDVPYKSLNLGMMHACGHDVHMASLLGSILILKDLRTEFAGIIKLIFQPSEEKNPGGASVMIEEGVLENPRVQSILGQHVYPDLEAGKVGFRGGKYMASTDEVYIEVRAKGGHAAMPENLVDTVLVASHIIVAMQQVVSRNSNPKMPTVLSFGKFIADGQTNVIPSVVKIAGTMRTFDETWRKEMKVRIEELAKGVARSMGAECDVHISHGYPYVYNEEELTQRTKQAAIELLGQENVKDLDLRMTGEDFGFYSQLTDACFYRLGTAKKSEEGLKKLHTSDFDIEPQSLKTGMALMSYLALKEMKFFCLKN